MDAVFSLKGEKLIYSIESEARDGTSFHIKASSLVRYSLKSTLGHLFVTLKERNEASYYPGH